MALKLNLVNDRPEFQKQGSYILALTFRPEDRTYVMHVHEDFIIPGVEEFLGFVQVGVKAVASPGLKETVKRSKSVDIEVLYTFSGDLMDSTEVYKVLIFKQYEYVGRLKTWTPGGLNDLAYVIRNSYSPEMTPAKRLLKKLKDNGIVERPKRGPHARPVYKYDAVTGEFICEYSSAGDAAAVEDISLARLYNCCGGLIKEIEGYIWSYKKQDRMNAQSRKDRAVYKYDSRTGYFIEGYADIEEAAKATGVTVQTIYRGRRLEGTPVGGYIWSAKKYDRYPDFVDLKEKAKEVARKREEYFKNCDFADLL